MDTVLLSIIEEVSDGILIIDEKSELLFFNDVFSRMFGLRADEILSGHHSFLKNIGLEHPEETSFSVHLSGTGFRFDEPTRGFSVKSTRLTTDNGFYFLIILRELVDGSNNQAVEQEYEQLFRTIGDAMFTARMNGRVETSNPAFAELLEYHEEDAPSDLREVYVYQDELEDKQRRLLEAGTVFNLETHLYNNNRAIKRVLDTSWIIKDQSGNVTGYATQWKDVTYLRNLESRLKISERNFTILFDTILSGIIIFDPEGTILNLNTAAERTYGYHWEEMVGQHYDDLLRVDRGNDAFAKLVALIQYNEGSYVESEVKRRRKDGAVIYTYASFTSIVDSTGTVIAYSMAEKDLTERVHLEQKLRDSLHELKDTQSAAIIGFAKLTEYRDKDTGAHLERIREFTRIMAQTLRRLPKYAAYITDDYLEDLSLSSILHDVGKVGISDSILLKPGRFNPDEYEQIKAHSRLGGEALEVVDKQLTKTSFLTMGKEIAYYHHERWDGSGYPEGLSGEGIPLSARIVSIADVYDALTSKRPYKEAYSHEKAVEIIAGERGKQFDPEIVDAFMENHQVFARIKRFFEFEENPETMYDLLEGKHKQKEVDLA
ncbi:PAS domain S-box protein [Sediminispirochaeta bajacaliforniensis]|uniref:PAS domain S-box protein n=1 Tax=Sediminispirochaeta bajacaliforniensis TaxID=148 RepID=UPI0003698035|nr:PAS domain S-box protein [Sediminispirochaeta bajacaliforniensis]